MIQCDVSKRILLIGEVFFDRHLDVSLVRLGGVFHLVRALEALQTDFAVAYICPEYLDSHCSEFLRLLGAKKSKKIGNVTGAPNIMEIGDSTESGDQRYSDLLGVSRSPLVDKAALQQIVTQYNPTDILITAGSYDLSLEDVALGKSARLHVDVDHEQSDLPVEIVQLSSIFTSTSGIPFKKANFSPDRLLEAWSELNARTIILKENRGGSRAWTVGVRNPIEGSSFPTFTRHSVGVGDCFNATWVALSEDTPISSRLAAAAYIASLYASTFEHDQFRGDVAAALQISGDIASLKGVRLPWEDRSAINIYIAAPDFPQIKTSLLDFLEAAIAYHNFRPRRPIKENGLGSNSDSYTERRALYFKDLELLASCDLLIAVPLENDPGTFVELGWFAGAGKPSILFDPTMAITNLFAVNSATAVCRTISQVVDKVFEILGRDR